MSIFLFSTATAFHLRTKKQSVLFSLPFPTYNYYGRTLSVPSQSLPQPSANADELFSLVLFSLVQIL